MTKPIGNPTKMDVAALFSPRGRQLDTQPTREHSADEIAAARRARMRIVGVDEAPEVDPYVWVSTDGFDQ